MNEINELQAELEAVVEKELRLSITAIFKLLIYYKVPGITIQRILTRKQNFVAIRGDLFFTCYSHYLAQRNLMVMDDNLTNEVMVIAMAKHVHEFVSEVREVLDLFDLLVVDSSLKEVSSIGDK